MKPAGTVRDWSQLILPIVTLPWSLCGRAQTVWSDPKAQTCPVSGPQGWSWRGDTWDLSQQEGFSAF